jgi:hypothetical protein
MPKSILSILALFGIVIILACTPELKPQTSQSPNMDAISTVTEMPMYEENPEPTEQASATSIPQSIQVTDTPTSTATHVVQSATSTVKSSATSTFEPMDLLRGDFYGVDDNHQGVGNAIIIQTQVDEYSLRLENFEVTSGPGLHVILAEDDNPYNVATLGDYLDLGELQSTMGDQVYLIPNDANLEKYGSVVVYCVPFQAIFAIAPIQ